MARAAISRVFLMASRLSLNAALHFIRMADREITGVMHAVGILKIFSGLDAQQNIMNIMVGLSAIMIIVRCNNRNSVQFGNSKNGLIYKNLIGNLRVILNLKEKIIRPENFLIHFYNFNGFFRPHPKSPPQFRLLNSRKSDYSFTVSAKQTMINPRFIIKTLQISLAREYHQVFITLGRFGKQSKMIYFCARFFLRRPLGAT